MAKLQLFYTWLELIYGCKKKDGYGFKAICAYHDGGFTNLSKE